MAERRLRCYECGGEIEGFFAASPRAFYCKECVEIMYELERGSLERLEDKARALGLEPMDSEDEGA